MPLRTWTRVIGSLKTTRASAPIVDHFPSPAMRVTLETARLAAAGDGIVLLLGESGSGKDYLARWIHDQSPGAHGPFFAINCAALSHELAESELFAHEPGAFTGARGRKWGLLELAEGGTLLLNEIGELPLALQSKLLTFLDTRSFLRVGGEKSIRVNARRIAATHRDLDRQMSEGRFLEALLYRLNVFSITVPPLRQRPEDIPIVVDQILARLAIEMQLTEIPKIDSATLRTLARYHWPGNVRELRNVIERAIILSPRGRIDLSLPHAGHQVAKEWSYTVRFPEKGTLDELTDEMTRELCVEALERSGGTRKEAARLLGISRDSLYRYLKRFGLERENQTD